METHLNCFFLIAASLPVLLNFITYNPYTQSHEYRISDNVIKFRYILLLFHVLEQKSPVKCILLINKV